MNTILTLIENKQYNKANLQLIQSLKNNTYTFVSQVFYKPSELLPFLHYKAMHHGLNIQEMQIMGDRLWNQFIHYPLCQEVLEQLPLSQELQYMAHESHGAPFQAMPSDDVHSFVFDIETTEKIPPVPLMKAVYAAFKADSSILERLSFAGQLKIVAFYYKEYANHLDMLPLYFHIMNNEQVRLHVKKHYTLPIELVPRDGIRYTISAFDTSSVLHLPHVRDLLLHEHHYWKKRSKKSSYSRVEPTNEYLTFLMALYQSYPDIFKEQGFHLSLAYFDEKESDLYQQWKQQLSQLITRAAIDETVIYHKILSDMCAQLTFLQQPDSGCCQRTVYFNYIGPYLNYDLEHHTELPLYLDL